MGDDKMKELEEKHKLKNDIWKMFIEIGAAVFSGNKIEEATKALKVYETKEERLLGEMKKKSLQECKAAQTKISKTFTELIEKLQAKKKLEDDEKEAGAPVKDTDKNKETKEVTDKEDETKGNDVSSWRTFQDFLGLDYFRSKTIAEQLAKAEEDNNAASQKLSEIDNLISLMKEGKHNLVLIQQEILDDLTDKLQ